MISILVSTAIRFPIRHQHFAIVAALSAYKKLARFLLPSFRYGRKREVETGKSRENDLFSSPRGRERKEEEKGKKEGEQEGEEGKAIFTYDFVRGIRKSGTRERARAFCG